MNRNRNRKRRKNRTSRPWVVLMLLLCLSVGFGYAGVTYVVEPWMERQAVGTTEHDRSDGNTSQPDQQTEMSGENASVVEDRLETVATTAYGVQLGSFSTEEAAKQRAAELRERGIEGKVQQRDNTWKVVAGEFATKEEARAMATDWRGIVGDAFVVGI